MRFVHSVLVKDRRGPGITKVLTVESISRFEPMEILCSERGTSLVVEVVYNITSLLVIKQILTYTLQVQASGAVEQRKHTIFRDSSWFINKGMVLKANLSTESNFGTTKYSSRILE